MIGLIKKDFYTMKSNIKVMVIMLIVFTAFAYFENMNLSMMAPFLATTLFISTFSYDEFNHFDIYGITLPKGRRDIVKSKYLTGLALTLISTAFSLIISYFANLSSGKTIDLEMMFAYTIAALSVIVLVIPLIFKFGIEKGRIAIFVFVYGIIFLVFAVAKLEIFKISSGVVNFLNNYWMIIFSIILVALSIGSYFLSKHFYKKREY